MPRYYLWRWGDGRDKRGRTRSSSFNMDGTLMANTIMEASQKVRDRGHRPHVITDYAHYTKEELMYDRPRGPSRSD